MKKKIMAEKKFWGDFWVNFSVAAESVKVAWKVSASAYFIWQGVIYRYK